MADDKQDKPVPLRPPRQQTDRPGGHGDPDGPAHHEPLSRNAPRQERYGPGTYGNDQFDAEHHDDFYDPGRGADSAAHDVPREEKPPEPSRRPDGPKP